jgi:hypothetical protein
MIRLPDAAVNRLSMSEESVRMALGWLQDARRQRWPIGVERCHRGDTRVHRLLSVLIAIAVEAAAPAVPVSLSRR